MKPKTLTEIIAEKRAQDAAAKRRNAPAITENTCCENEAVKRVLLAFQGTIERIENG